MSKRMKIIPLVIMGCGGVGRQLIHHIVNTRELHASQGIHLRVLGVCDSQSLLMAAKVPEAELSDECLKNICHLKSSGSPLSSLDSIGNDGFRVSVVHEIVTCLLDIQVLWASQQVWLLLTALQVIRPLSCCTKF